ncbi:hypothetical protein BMS3Bbin03_02111 [bacterium BMS3Bbin03]|nr:hypothetical protein BMS3Bbin03_02111 [bacterium BMS3Bbin03]
MILIFFNFKLLNNLLSCQQMETVQGAVHPLAHAWATY